METIRGVITKVLKKGATRSELSFVLVEFEHLESGKLVEARLSGRIGDAGIGDAFFAEGNWRTQDFRGEKQHVLHAARLRPGVMTTSAGALRYLELNFARRFGITIEALTKLAAKHGKDTLHDILEDPDLLVQCSSDPARNRESIKLQLSKKLSIKQARDILEEAGFDERQIEKVLSQFKSKAYEILTNNPYEVTSVPSIEFKHADKLAQRLGVSGEDERRISAAVVDYIKDAESEGSSCVSSSQLIASIANAFKIPADVVQDLILAKAQARNPDGFYAFRYPDSTEMPALTERNYRNELAAAMGILKFLEKGRRNDPEQVKRASEEVLENSRLDGFQKKAVEIAATEPLSIITGGPGTGKSTILKSMIEVSKKVEKAEVILTAPTGQAAKRAEEVTGDEGQTLHLLLGMRQDEETGETVFTRNQENPLPDNVVVVVDETSMMDNQLLAALFLAMPTSGRIILQGDPHQLPSVGVGRVLADLLEMNVDGHTLIPVARLVNVYRQDKNSRIPECAEDINAGVMPMLDASVRGGVTFRECSSREITQRVVAIVRNLKKEGYDIERHVAIISPQAPGAGGTWELNQAMADEFNTRREPIPGVAAGPFDDPRMPIPHIGDRVMITENDKDNAVMNGDIGVIDSVHPDPKRPNRDLINVKLDDGRDIFIPDRQWRNLILAYAITCHKSQGSQYPIVILPFSDMHQRMAERTLLYTAWTRAKKLVVGIGSKDVMRQFVETHTANHRFTILRRLTEALAVKRGIKPRGEKAEYVPPLSLDDQKPKAIRGVAPSQPKLKTKVRIGRPAAAAGANEADTASGVKTSSPGTSSTAGTGVKGASQGRPKVRLGARNKPTRSM